ncbi:kelch-like protein 28 [Episyrphus balteatus]|uniref:kelch-like protein 28 n=1 Tax=Episyrphus balteatus TaxID=286459 RepID=UPI0024863584|nr:kelch-like protein 28 [Episyrphus balteatus]
MSTTNQIPKNHDKIIFKCDKHSTIISEKLQSFYQENELFDTVIIAGSDLVNIHAHSVVLCALSEYFLQIFRRTERTSKDNIVELKEINASTLKVVIDFMYSGTIELSLQTVEAVLRTASLLKLKTLVDGCCELIETKIDSRNSLYWFRLAKELSLDTLKDKSLECTYIHFEKISRKKEFMMLNENELEDLLFNDNPHGDFEEEIFFSMVAWISYDKLNREHLVFELLSKVRFWVLTPKFIVENRRAVCKTVESYELICSWLQWHLSPESRTNDHSKCAFKPRKKPKLAVVSSFCYRSVKRQININTFDPKTNLWSIKIKRRPSSEKDNFSSIVVDGMVIMVGGEDTSGWKNRVDCCYLDTFQHRVLPSMINTPNQRCQLVDLNGYLCAFAAVESTNSYSIEIYNFSTKKWSNLQPFYPISMFSQTASHNGVLYILDFYNGFLQTYDTSTNKWNSRAIKKDSLKHFGLAAVEGFLYVFGGCSDNYDHEESGEDDEYEDQDDDEGDDDEVDDNWEYLETVQRYDLTNDSWCEMTSLPYIQGTSFIKTKVLEDKIIASDSCNIAEYDIDTDKWNILSPLLDSGNSFDIYLYYS